VHGVGPFFVWRVSIYDFHHKEHRDHGGFLVRRCHRLTQIQKHYWKSISLFRAPTIGSVGPRML
jgi:hypothetical protein